MSPETKHYTPGPARGEVRKGDAKSTLILTRQLRHPPERVWQAITDPEHLREWAPFDADGNLGTVGSTVKLTWMGTTTSFDTTVTKADRPRLLEYGDFRWELEPVDNGTRLTLWAAIDSRFVAMGAAGWHISLDVLDSVLNGDPIRRIAGPEAMKFEGWHRLKGEYATLFGVENPSW